MKIRAAILFFCLFAIGASAQTFTFQCVDSTALTGVNCDLCPVTNIQSRSFCGLLISKNGTPYKWIDQPYTMRVRPGDVVEYFEQIPTIPNIQTQDRISVSLVQTPFSTIQGMIDSTYCHCASGQGAMFYASDSINTAPIFKGDTLTIVGRGIIGVEFDSLLQKYVITADTTGLGGGGGGGSSPTDLSFSGTSSPVSLLSSTGTDVSFIAGTGISLSATSSAMTITNTAPDQVVSIAGAGTSVVAGTYPNFTVTSNDAFVGTVTSVSSGNLSPLFNVTVTNPTTTPAFSFAQINQNANLVFAGPATGAASAPTFRALVAADIPAASASKWTDAGAFTYLTATTDRALVGSATEINSSYIFQAKGGAFIQGAGSTSATFALVAEKADGTDILNIRNDGRVGILNSAPAYTLDVIGDIAINQTSAYYLENTKMAYGKPANHNYYFGGAGNVTGNATKNIAIGTSALLSLGATGGFNVAIGFEAGKLITTGQGNTAIGTQALATNTVGNNNFALGTEALKLNTASNNVAVGGLSQPSTSTGDKNVSLGYFTLNGNTTGFENVAIGNVALQLNSDGYRNIGIGSEALLSNVSGFGNIAIGNSALYSTTGSRNTVIGYASGLFLTTGSQNIVIGASLRPINDAGSNQMTIGNIIYATGVDGTGTTVSTGNVGIKTNAPSQALHVSGNLRVTGAYYDSNNDPGTAGQILSTTATGTDWIAAPSAPTIVTANNALTLTGTNLQWGGALVQNTTVDQDGFWQLHKDGRKEFFRYNTGNPFTDVNVTGTVDITGKAADPSINPTPSEDNILTIRGHNGTSTYYANAMFFGTYTTAAYGSWIQTRSESAYTTYYPLNINVNGGKVGIGRDPNTDQLNAHVTISRSLTGSTIDGILLHIENTEGNKTAMSWGHGYDNIDGEIGYFDTEGVFRMTNRNTGTGETIRFAIGGETTDRAVMLPSTAASKVRFGVGFNNTTDLTSTLLSKGSLGAAALSTSGAPTFDETKFFVVYTAAGNQTYTLPAQTDCKGRIFWIQNNSSAGTITLSVAVKKANGATFNTLAPGEFCQFISDGADYWGYKQTSL